MSAAGSVTILFGLSIIYGMTGTLNFEAASVLSKAEPCAR
jgi:NADH:ubiquinone oxidoreductase subunit 2 (subunit N)